MTQPTEFSAVSGHIPALVFVNRAAGRRRAHTYLPRLRELFESRDSSVQFIETDSASELEEAARQALVQEPRVLLAMGGDGTFQALANGVSGSDATIGILPTGGGNDFGAALGLPADPLQAVERVLKGRLRFVDLIRVRTVDGRTRLYAGGGGIGLDAEAARYASGAYRRLPGRFRYIASALRALLEHEPLKVRLEFPGTNIPAVETTSLLTCVLNTPTYGGGLRLAPDARIDDGLFQVVLVGDLSTVTVLKLLPRLMRSGELRTSQVKRWCVRAVRMSANRPCLFHGDGEILGPAPIEVEIVPRAVRVLAPAGEP
ncbi:MAG TPA: diacylglycerol kinase family protein [Candidatus Acidoferrum sp.]